MTSCNISQKKKKKKTVFCLIITEMGDLYELTTQIQISIYFGNDFEDLVPQYERRIKNRAH